MRILGIDYGERRIGLALSDPLGIIAGALPTFDRKGGKDEIAFFRGLIAEKEVERIVIGLPKNMDGSEGPQALAVRAFGEKLKTLGIEMIFKDERLSSVSANRVLDEAEMHWSKRRDVVDAVAAVIILQSYLDRIAKEGENK